MPKKQPIPKVDPKDFAILVTDAGTDHPKYYPTTTTALNRDSQTPNLLNQTYPILPAGKFYIKPDEFTVAPPPVMDQKQKNIFGVQPPLVVFGQPPPERNPSELVYRPRGFE